MTNEQSTIAAIGDSDLATLLQLSGMSRIYILEKSDSLESDVRNRMKELVDEPNISIIAIQSEYAGYVRDIIDAVSEDKYLFPVIIEVPARTGQGSEDASKYYRAFVRKYVGFDIEI